MSDQLLTTADLIQYEKHIGGINRAATVLAELVESMKSTDPFQLLIKYTQVSVLQRLGYLLESVTDRPELADDLYNALQKDGTALYRTPLKAGEPEKGYSADNRWKVIENIEIETDFLT